MRSEPAAEEPKAAGVYAAQRYLQFFFKSD
jgi:hypothetical protein